jgi:hypothetical protein
MSAHSGTRSGLSIFLMVAAISDFNNGGLMLLGFLPITPVYAAIGIFYAILLVIGGIFSLLLCYGIWALKNWARLILQIGFPIQVLFNVILDPIIYDTYFLLVLSIIIAFYLQMSSTRAHFS